MAHCHPSRYLLPCMIPSWHGWIASRSRKSWRNWGLRSGAHLPMTLCRPSHLWTPWPSMGRLHSSWRRRSWRSGGSHPRRPTRSSALIQDAAYESLLRSTRQQYHQRIAQALTERFPETAETQPEVLAQHYTAAGVHAQALSYWQRAGQRALERSALREAVGCFAQALSALAHLPEQRDTREQAIDLRLDLHTVLVASGDSQSRQRMLAALREAESLAEALGDPRRLGRVAVILSREFYQRGAHDQVLATAP